MRTIALGIALFSLVAIAQNRKDKEGFMVSAHGISTTNESTKLAGESRKELFHCDYDENGEVVKNCVLGEGVTLTEVIQEFVVRDTKRAQQHAYEMQLLRKSPNK